MQPLNGQERYRVNHDIIRDSNRYWDLNTLHQDPSGGGDPVRDSEERIITSHRGGENYWLRFEPFILHVMCRSLSAASALMASARPGKTLFIFVLCNHLSSLH